MLLWLAEWLRGYVSAFAVFQYLTFRGILGVLMALAITLMVGPRMIRLLERNQIGQAVRDDGPQTHLGKAGTPTMGGALILVGIIASTLLCGDLRNRYVWVALLAFGSAAKDSVIAFGKGGKHFEDWNEIPSQLKSARTILVKGSRFMRMERVVALLAGEMRGSKGGVH